MTKIERQIKILEIMKKEKCQWDEAVKKQNERKSLAEFIHPI